MSQVIETQALRKSYGRFGALHGIDLAMPAGSVFALMGASGAGKTTAIKILLNLIEPTHGAARVLGVDSRRIGPPDLAQIGYVSENQQLPARLRVAHFFEYLRPCYPGWDLRLEQSLRDQLRLPPERRIGELSHGMRLKLALASALAYRPKLLILDEPFSGLDALAREEIVGEFLRQAGETSILISSHELDEIERLATHVGFLHEGRLLFQGPLAELYERGRLLLAGTSAERASLRAIFIAMVRAAALASPTAATA
jgi:ABC-2 type transport system ATP-binding protein